MKELSDLDRSEIITLRMPRSIIQILKKEAGRENTNTNSLANQIIRGYFDFHQVASNAGMMPFPKKLLRKMMDRLDDDEIKELCKSAAESDIPSIVYMKTNKFTLEAFLDSFLTWARFSGFTYRDVTDDEVRTITIQHNMGEKWSQFMKGALEIIFTNLEVRCKYETGENIIIIGLWTDRY